MNQPIETDVTERKEAPASSKDRTALKELRRARASSIEAAKARLKEQQKEIRLVKKALAGGPRTIPETARETGLEPSRVLYHVATLTKYGELREEGKDGSYFRYGLVPEGSAESGSRPETC
jgi:hypothetical protein